MLALLGLFWVLVEEGGGKGVMEGTKMGTHTWCLCEGSLG